MNNLVRCPECGSSRVKVVTSQTTQKATTFQCIDRDEETIKLKCGALFVKEYNL